MIRTRVRFERARHKVLTKELEQARQIQLAWLPDLKNVPAPLPRCKRFKTRPADVALIFGDWPPTLT